MALQNYFYFYLAQLLLDTDVSELLLSWTSLSHTDRVCDDEQFALNLLLTLHAFPRVTGNQMHNPNCTRTCINLQYELKRFGFQFIKSGSCSVYTGNSNWKFIHVIENISLHFSAV